MKEQERREAGRIAFDSEVHIRCGRVCTIDGKVDARDISIRGMYIQTWQRVPVETLCKIDLALSGDSSKMHFTVSGVVCRHDDDGMGIAFLKLSPDNYLHIKTLVQVNAATEQ